jgi:hypothetical protein
MKLTLSQNPNREFASYLLSLHRKDIFEVVQEMTSSIDNNNIEKLWLLLIISTKMEFISKAKEIIKKILEIDNTNDIFKFYIENEDLLSKDKGIVKLLNDKQK